MSDTEHGTRDVSIPCSAPVNPQEHSAALQPCKSTGPSCQHCSQPLHLQGISSIRRRVLMPSLVDSTLKTSYRYPISSPHPPTSHTPLMLEVTDHSPIPSKGRCFRHPLSTPDHYQTTQRWVLGAKTSIYTHTVSDTTIVSLK